MSVLFDFDPKILPSYMIATCSFTYGIKFFFFNIEIQLIYNVVLLSGVSCPFDFPRMDIFSSIHPVGWLETHSSSP